MKNDHTWTPMHVCTLESGCKGGGNIQCDEILQNIQQNKNRQNVPGEM